MGLEVLQRVSTWDADGRNNMTNFGETLWRFDVFSNKTFKVVTIQVISINQSITLLRINDIHKNYYKNDIQNKYTTMWRLNVVSY